MERNPEASVDPHDRRVAALYTPLLRSGTEPRWENLRARLAEEGISPEDAAVGTLFPDNGSLEFGILITKDGRAFSFDVDFLRYPDGTKVPSREDAWIRSWNELDERQRDTYARAIEAGQELLDEETSGRE